MKIDQFEWSMGLLKSHKRIFKIWIIKLKWKQNIPESIIYEESFIARSLEDVMRYLVSTFFYLLVI